VFEGDGDERIIPYPSDAASEDDYDELAKLIVPSSGPFSRTPRTKTTLSQRPYRDPDEALGA